MSPVKTQHAKLSRTLDLDEIIHRLETMGNPEALEGMSRFGITTKKAYGVSVPKLRTLTKEIGRDHKIALSLWDTGIHEARILAGMVDDPKMVIGDRMESWARDFDSWDIVDSSCGSLFDKTPFAVGKALE